MLMRIGAAALAIAAGTLAFVYVSTQPPESPPTFVPEARADTPARGPDYGWRTNSADFQDEEKPVTEYY